MIRGLQWIVLRFTSLHGLRPAACQRFRTYLYDYSHPTWADLQDYPELLSTRGPLVLPQAVGYDDRDELESWAKAQSNLAHLAHTATSGIGFLFCKPSKNRAISSPSSWLSCSVRRRDRCSERAVLGSNTYQPPWRGKGPTYPRPRYQVSNSQHLKPRLHLWRTRPLQYDIHSDIQMRFSIYNIRHASDPSLSYALKSGFTPFQSADRYNCRKCHVAKLKLEYVRLLVGGRRNHLLSSPTSRRTDEPSNYSQNFQALKYKRARKAEGMKKTLRRSTVVVL